MNSSKTLSRQILLTVSFAGTVLFLVLIITVGKFAVSLIAVLQLALKSPGQSSPSLFTTSVVPHKQKKVNTGLPVRLRIPRINVNASLDRVGVTPEGELGVPIGPSNAAWYSPGPRPGQKGTSVIDGHFGYKNHTPAVFDNLYKLHKGDNVYVEDEKGGVVTFVVRELRTYVQNAQVRDVFVASDTKAHLNLITCQGKWNNAKKSYSSRLVVFADKQT